MGKLKEIVHGWWNLAVGKTSKEINMRRESCDLCPHITKKDVCVICGCFIPAKIRSVKSKCPIKRWQTIKNIIMKNVTVILDAGHGGLDPSGEYVTAGKRSPVWNDGSVYYEGVGNRIIRQHIAESLQNLGIKYKFLTLGYQDVPLKERCTRANYTQGKSFGISIHSNAGGGTGIEVFTSPGDTPADPMATLSVEVFKTIFPEYADRIRSDYRDGDVDKEAKFSILTGTKMPFFLPEAFFMDQEKECKEILMTEKGLKLIAEWHTNTIVRILNELY